MDMDFVLFAVGIIVAIAEIFKLFGVGAKALPIINIVTGVVFSYFYSGAGIKASILMGLIVGLTASGLYSAAKNTAEGFNLK